MAGLPQLTFSPHSLAARWRGQQFPVSLIAMTTLREQAAGARHWEPGVDVPGNGRHREARSSLPGRLLDAFAVSSAELLSLLAPVECVSCGLEDIALCSACARRLRTLCAHPFRAEQQAPALVDVDGRSRLAVVAAGPYRDELAQVILSFKRHGQPRLAHLLAPLLGRALQSAAGQRRGLSLVPVPSSNAAFRRRGFSPVDEILAVLSRQGRVPSAATVHGLRKAWPWKWSPGEVEALLIGTGRGDGQKGLGRGARSRRVRGSIRARRWPRSRSIAGRHCLIIDDVLTTGSTLAEAARAIEDAGGVVCGAVVLAATRPPAGTDAPVAVATDAPLVATRAPAAVPGSQKTQTKNK